MVLQCIAEFSVKGYAKNNAKGALVFVNIIAVIIGCPAAAKSHGNRNGHCKKVPRVYAYAGD